MNAHDLNRVSVLRRRLRHLDSRIEDGGHAWDLREADALARVLEIVRLASEHGLLDDEQDEE